MLPRTEFHYQLFFHGNLDIRSRGQRDDRRRGLLTIQLQPALRGKIRVALKLLFHPFEALLRVLDRDLITDIDNVVGNIDLSPVDADVTMPDQLSGGLA